VCFQLIEAGAAGTDDFDRNVGQSKRLSAAAATTAAAKRPHRRIVKQSTPAS